MEVGFGTVAAGCLVIGLVAMKMQKWQRATPWLFLIGGLGLAGVADAVIDRIAEALNRVAGAGTAAVFGVSAPIVVVVALGLILWFGMGPKGGRPAKATPRQGGPARPQPKSGSPTKTPSGKTGGPTKWTPWLALIFPAVLAAVPGLGGLVDVAVNVLSAAVSMGWDMVMQLVGAF